MRHMFRVHGLVFGFGVWGAAFRVKAFGVQGLGSRVEGLPVRADRDVHRLCDVAVQIQVAVLFQGFEFRVWGLGFGVWGLGFGLGFWVLGFGVWV